MSEHIRPFSASPSMSAEMARATQCLNVQPVATGIAEMMMVIRSLRSTINTGQPRWFGQSIISNGRPNNVVRLIFDRQRGREKTPFFSHFYSNALIAASVQAVIARFIFRKRVSYLPLFTGGTPLQSARQPGFVFIQANAAPSGCGFQSAYFSCHKYLALMGHTCSQSNIGEK